MDLKEFEKGYKSHKRMESFSRIIVGLKISVFLFICGSLVCFTYFNPLGVKIEIGDSLEDLKATKELLDEKTKQAELEEKIKKESTKEKAISSKREQLQLELNSKLEDIAYYEERIASDSEALAILKEEVEILNDFIEKIAD